MWIEDTKWKQEYDNKKSYHPEVHMNIQFLKYIINWLL